MNISLARRLYVSSTILTLYTLIGELRKIFTSMFLPIDIIINLTMNYFLEK